MKHHIIIYKMTGIDSYPIELVSYRNVHPTESRYKVRKACVMYAMIHPDRYVVRKSGAKVLNVYHGNHMWQGKMIPSELMAIFGGKDTSCYGGR